MAIESDDDLRDSRIALVDDDELFRESLQQNLADAGFDVTEFEDGPGILAALDEGARFDLVLLDWKMPEVSGIEVLRSIRAGMHDVPVIFLTVLSDQIYEEAALIGGAVDFVEKSRSFAILLKRIELILGKSKAHTPAPSKEGEQDEGRTLQRGPLLLDRKSYRAQWRGAEVPLTLNEFRIVDLLASRAGQDIRFREIYDIVRGEGFVAGYGPNGHRQNVRTFVKRIRQKFRSLDSGFDRIENYPGFGYRWQEDDG